MMTVTVTDAGWPAKQPSHHVMTRRITGIDYVRGRGRHGSGRRGADAGLPPAALSRGLAAAAAARAASESSRPGPRDSGPSRAQSH
jgi:hypothetical protein